MSSLSQPFPDVFLSTLSNGQYFIGDLFQRKFGSPAPAYGESVIAFYRKTPLHFLPLCHMNYLQHDELLLSGGAMTNGAVFHEMPPSLAEQIRLAGGIYFHLIKYAFDYFGNNYEAIFGYAGDERALEVDLAAGYEATPYPFLISYFHKPVSQERKQFLIEKAHKLGPF